MVVRVSNSKSIISRNKSTVEKHLNESLPTNANRINAVLNYIV